MAAVSPASTSADKSRCSAVLTRCPTCPDTDAARRSIVSAGDQDGKPPRLAIFAPYGRNRNSTETLCESDRYLTGVFSVKAKWNRLLQERRACLGHFVRTMRGRRTAKPPAYLIHRVNVPQLEPNEGGSSPSFAPNLLLTVSLSSKVRVPPFNAKLSGSQVFEVIFPLTLSCWI